jgi:hypothetical protein
VLRKFPVLQNRCFSVNFKWCQLEGEHFLDNEYVLLCNTLHVCSWVSAQLGLLFLSQSLKTRWL